MSETANTATIKIVTDASGVEAALRPVEDAVARTRRSLDNLGANAREAGKAIEEIGHASGADAVGEGAAAAAQKVERATAAMAAGATESVRYYQALANGGGLGLEALRVGQLEAGDAAAAMGAKLRQQEQAGESAFGNLSGMAGKFKDVLLGIGSKAVSVGEYVAAMVNDAIDDMAKLDAMTQKTGASVEGLSRVQKLGIVFDTDMGTIDGVLTKLSQGMATVDGETNKTQTALAALGVSSQDSAGKLRDPVDVLVEAAKKLQDYEDNATKAALVTDLIGESGPGVLPFLNSLAENYDNVSGISAQAAGAAATFQDQLGWIKLQSKDVAGAVATQVLPALNNLTGAFLDVYKGKTDIVGSELREWADAVAMGIAHAADAAVILGRALAIVWNSVKAVRADVDVAMSALWNFSPIVAGAKLLAGGSPVADFRKVVNERNKIVEDANVRLEELANRPLYQFADAMKARVKAQSDAVAQAAQPSEKPELDYRSGKPKKPVATKTAKSTPAQVSTTSGNASPVEGMDEANSSKAYQANIDRLIKAATEEAEKNEQLAATYGKTKLEIANLELAGLEAQLKQDGLKSTEIDNLAKQIAPKKRNVEALTKLEGLEAAKKATADLDKFLEPTKVEAFGESLKKAFGAAGEPLGKLVVSMQKFGDIQAATKKAHADADKEFAASGDQQKYLERLGQIQQKNTKEELAGYGDMASAAAGFFGEHSRGYQSLMAVSKVFHAAEVAMTTAELVPKAISAVLTQGGGEPFTAFGRMAAMAAIVAGLGVAIGGIGGGADTTAADRQKATGTGTVLGDATAKSESISNGIALIEKHTYQGLTINTNMLTALRSIDNSIVSFASQLVQTAGVTGKYAATTSSFGGGFLGSVLGSIFGGKTSVQDTGFTLGATSLAQALAGGVNGMQYTDMHKSGGWFSSGSSWSDTKSLGADANAQFTAIIRSLSDSVREAGTLLGLSGSDFTSRLDAFVIDIGRISLKDLKGDDVQKALEAAFSKLGDQMAQFAVGGLQKFQQVGEGYLETLVRIASEYQTIDVVFQSFGKTFGAVGTASIEARDRLVQLSGGLEDFTNQGEYFLKNFFDEQEQAAALQSRIAPTLAQYGLSTTGDDPSKMFRDFIVGLDTTTESGAQAYAVLMSIAPAFKQIVDAAEDVRKEHDSLQNQLDELTMTSQQLLDKQRDALDASNRDLFDKVQAAKKAADAEKTAAEALTSARSALNEAYNTEASAIQATIDRVSNFAASLRKLRDGALLGSLSPLTPQQKYQEAKAQYESVLVAARLGDEAAQSQYQEAYNAFLSASQVANASGAQYQSDFAHAQAATEDAIQWAEKQVDVGKASLGALQKQVQGLIDIKGGVLSVGAAISALAVAMGSKGDGLPASAQQSAIETLYQSLLGRSADQAGLQFWQQAMTQGVSIADIAAAISQSAEYRDYMLGAGSVSVAASAAGGDSGRQAKAAPLLASAAIDYSTMGTTAMTPLVDEIKALRADNQAMREQLTDLRKDQDRQTGDLIEANASAVAEAARAVAEATVQAANVAAQANQTRVKPE